MFDIIVILIHILYDCACVLYFCIISVAIFGNSASDWCKGVEQILVFDVFVIALFRDHNIFVHFTSF